MSLTYKSKPQSAAASSRYSRSSCSSTAAMKIIFQFPKRCVCQPGRLRLGLGLGSWLELGVHCEGASRVRVPRERGEREGVRGRRLQLQVRLQLHLNWLHESINCSRSIAASLHTVHPTPPSFSSLTAAAPFACPSVPQLIVLDTIAVVKYQV